MFRGSADLSSVSGIISARDWIKQIQAGFTLQPLMPNSNWLPVSDSYFLLPVFTYTLKSDKYLISAFLLRLESARMHGHDLAPNLGQGISQDQTTEVNNILDTSSIELQGRNSATRQMVLKHF